MAKKRFANSMFGFDKANVNTYIENLTRDYEEKLTAKDMEIEKLVAQLKNVNKKYEAIKLEEERILTEKEKISQALVSANEKADKIVVEAKERVSAEVVELEAAAEKEREKIVDIKRELMKMKAEASLVLDKFGKALNEIAFTNMDDVKEKTEEETETADEAKAEAAAAEEEGDDFFG
ncbi:MAG: DivIVA domain-containing protein [Clostridia bacterium]|nr:DivIVA domain-containing protein [Clostridia bacterium]